MGFCQFGSFKIFNRSNALSRQSNNHLGSFFIFEINLITSSFKPFGALKPLLNRILVPSAGVGAGAGAATSEDDLEAQESDEVEVEEGESLEDIKAKLKPKKASISAEMLDTANTYDDKVAVIRMIFGDEAGKVSNVFRQLMQKDV